jgi:predicted GIY-YIG superfamily endonuclease
MGIVLYEISCITPNHFYVGITSQPEVRLQRHRKGNRATFTAMHGVSEFKIIGEFKDEIAAKMAERDHVLYLRSQGYVVAGAAWTRDETDEEFYYGHYA